MVVPAPLVGIGLAELMNRPGWSGRVYDSPFIVALAFLVRFLPYQTVATVLSLRAVPVILEEDAFVCGATRLQVTRYVVAPLCVGGAVVGALIVLILSLGEVGASVLVAPPGRTTLTIHFFTLIHYGVYADAAAICLILAGLVVALSALVVISIDGIGSLRKASRRLY
jgi:iron(III) transport system permease protein